MLEEVVRAVNGRCEVYLDGGVRRGTDVFKVSTPRTSRHNGMGREARRGEAMECDVAVMWHREYAWRCAADGELMFMHMHM